VIGTSCSGSRKGSAVEKNECGYGCEEGFKHIYSLLIYALVLEVIGWLRIEGQAFMPAP
jgi:hypothetical protein